MSAGTAARPALEVADIFRAHGAAYLAEHGSQLNGAQRRALQELAVCRTAALGGHTEACAGCGRLRPVYNSCRNRHCPKCQPGRAAAWLQREAVWLLPVEYHHVVFTLPQEAGPLALQNPRVVYDLLFRAAWEAVQELAADPHYLGAEVGLVAVLHTWGQQLTHHPHLHCVVTGGGLACSPGGVAAAPPAWRACRPGFFLPVRVLSRLFRGKFVAGLRAAYEAGRLGCHGRLAALAERSAFAAWLVGLAGREWVVYSKPPFAGPEVVLKYLARYTHRICVSNRRLVALADGQVTLCYKDYADDRRQKTLTVSAAEFIRRFLQHVLPAGFVRVRHYGLLANRYREAKLAVCRQVLLVRLVAVEAVGSPQREPTPCPCCGGTTWRVVGRVPRPTVAEVCRLPLGEDTS
jgi:hypothetical protein